MEGGAVMYVTRYSYPSPEDFIREMRGQRILELATKIHYLIRFEGPEIYAPSEISEAMDIAAGMIQEDLVHGQ